MLNLTAISFNQFVTQVTNTHLGSTLINVISILIISRLINYNKLCFLSWRLFCTRRFFFLAKLHAHDVSIIIVFLEDRNRTNLFPGKPIIAGHVVIITVQIANDCAPRLKSNDISANICAIIICVWMTDQ